MRKYFIKKSQTEIAPEEVLLREKSRSYNIETMTSGAIFKTISFSIAALLGVLFLTSFYSQVFNFRHWKILAETNRTRVVVKPAPRGVILDRYGKPLVTNEQILSLVISPGEILGAGSGNGLQQALPSIQKLSQITGLSEEYIREKLVNQIKFSLVEPVLILQDVPQDLALQIELNKNQLPGTYLIQDFKRVYLYSDAFAHVLGYLGYPTKDEYSSNESISISDLIGRDGLEAYYDKYLRGVNGRRSWEISGSLDIVREIGSTEPNSGNDLYTTIDKDLQLVFFDSFQRHILARGLNRGAGIIINPKTGEVLSLFSFPSFDPNVLTTGKDKSIIQRILSDRNKPLFNRVIQGQYSPGSTIKPLIALAALEESVVTPKKQIYSSGQIVIPNPYFPDQPSIFHDWKAHGWVDMERALAVSSNVYFYTIGGGFENTPGLGISRIDKYFDIFKLNQRYDIDLNGEVEGFYPTPELKAKLDKKDSVWRVGDTYNTSIGQGYFGITPLALIEYLGGIINNENTIMRPYLAEKIQTPGGETILKNEKKEVAKLSLKPENVRVVKAGMRAMITTGTAQMLSSVGMPVAGKTGTPQVFGGERLNGLFIGYAPSDNPDIAIMVLVENIPEGSLAVLPIAQDVFSWYAQNRYKK